MKLLCTFFVGFALGSTSIFAQSPFLDFGAIPDVQKRQEIQQWWIEKEILNGRNPFAESPCR